MSETITFDVASDSRGTLNLNAKSETGIYAGVCEQRAIFTGPLSDEILSSMTARSLFDSRTAPGFDVDAIFQRKISNIHNGQDRSAIHVAYYFEFHIHKKAAINTPFVFDFDNKWFFSNVRVFAADVLRNTSLYNISPGYKHSSLFETDPVLKARQIYDSV